MILGLIQLLAIQCLLMKAPDTMEQRYQIRSAVAGSCLSEASLLNITACENNH